MKNDTYFTHLQRGYNANNERNEHAYTDLFTVSTSRTSLRSGIDDEEPGAGSEGDNIYSVIRQHTGCRRRSKIIIAVLVVVVIAAAVAIVLAITAAGKDKLSASPGKTNMIYELCIV